jgi:hypothetical protein
MTADIKTVLTGILNELWKCGYRAPSSDDVCADHEIERMQFEHVDDALNKISAVLAASERDRKDAERYRFLRETMNNEVPADDVPQIYWNGLDAYGDQRPLLDAAIDAAVAASKSSDPANTGDK